MAWVWQWRGTDDASAYVAEAELLRSQASLGKPGIAIVLLLARGGVGINRPDLNKCKMCLEEGSWGAWRLREWFGSEVPPTQRWYLQPGSGSLPQEKLWWWTEMPFQLPSLLHGLPELADKKTFISFLAGLCPCNTYTTLPTPHPQQCFPGMGPGWGTEALLQAQNWKWCPPKTLNNQSKQYFNAIFKKLKINANNLWRAKYQNV